jgi:hypothetical protein
MSFSAGLFLAVVHAAEQEPGIRGEARAFETVSFRLVFSFTFRIVLFLVNGSSYIGLREKA